MRTLSSDRRLACALHGATVAHHTGPTPTVNDVIGATLGLYRIEITEDEAQAALDQVTDRRTRLLPPLPEHRAAERHQCLADLLRTLAQHAAIDAVTTHLMASHCSLDVTIRLSYAYDTDEAIDILRVFTTLIGLPTLPARLRLSAPRAQGLKTVRTLHLAGHHGGTDLNDCLLTLRVDVTLDTTGTEKRHEELMRAAQHGEAAGTR